MFDLGEGERDAKRKGVPAIHDRLQEADGLSDEEATTTLDDEEDDEILDSENEREAELAGLEGQLDGLYDEYKERMAERDAKWKVKQARMKDKNFDAWHGIKEGSDSEDDLGKKSSRVFRMSKDNAGEEDEETDEGGYEKVAAMKAAEGDDLDSSDESDEEDKSAKPTRRSVRFDNEAGPSRRPRTRPTGLVTSLRESQDRAQLSRQAQQWFDQSVFKGVGDLAALDAAEEDAEQSGSDVSHLDEDGDVEMGDESDAEDAEEEADFEVVRQDQDDDTPAWDVDDEDQDEVKRKIIQGESSTR